MIREKKRAAAGCMFKVKVTPFVWAGRRAGDLTQQLVSV